jgi:hypothetical protein
MSDRSAYLAAAIRLYLGLPGAPPRASRSDFAVAATLYARAVPLDTLAHAMRLATLRRHLRAPDFPLEPVSSLAYYRRVLDHLTPDALDPGYVDYVAAKYRQLFGATATSRRRPPSDTALRDRQIPAPFDRR